MSHNVPARLDHLVYATPRLDDTRAWVESAFGLRALPGGAHSTWGTRNAVVPLGHATYLEIIGPDRAPPGAPSPRLFGIDRLVEPRLATWAAKGADLRALVGRARDAGIVLGEVLRGARDRPDGSRLTWELTDPYQERAGALLPFFIDWGRSPHPSADARAEVTLEDFHAEHPEPEPIRRLLDALGLDLRIQPGPRPALIATFRSPRGTVTLV